MRRILPWIATVAVMLCGQARGRTLYETSFDTPDAPAKWTVVAGTWQHDPAAGTYTCSGTNELLSVYQGPLSTGANVNTLKDYVVTAELSRNTSAGGIIGRYRDISNYYYLRHHADAGQLQLYRIATAGKVMIASASFPTANQPDRFILSLDMVGTLLIGKMLDLDGNELAGVRMEDTTFSSGPAGLRNWSGTQTYHSFMISQVDKARLPDPADEAVGVESPLLKWIPGTTAVFHNVYVGTTPELTEAHLAGSQLITALYWHVPGFEPGVTYYWRVDELEADMKTTYTGDVWSFVTQALTAYHPQPADGAHAVTPDTTLTWLPGRGAIKHRLYLGDDANAVAQGAADTDKGELTEPNFTPQALTGGTTYFWRVDEAVAGGTVQPGPVWSFTTFISVEDFESYTDDEGSRIYQTWIDGWTNDNGGTVGHIDAPFAERTILHAGKQSMPFEYNNVDQPYYSEAERLWDAPQNWTIDGAGDLSLWFRGNPVGFAETASGIAMSASGTDIWGAADEFRFAYKQLNGNGTIVVKVDGVANTDGWAKAGVMIRASLDPGSPFAYVVATPAQGVSFGWRLLAGNACDSATQAGIRTPQWVKLTRTGAAFTAQYSADGITWLDVRKADGTVASTTITMAGSALIGLCVTSHNAAAVTTAQFSQASTTGGASGSWQVAEIGVDHPDNNPESFYVALEDGAGHAATVVHPDPSAVNATTWTEWRIPLSDFAGVDATEIERMYLGVGNRDKPVQAGRGTIYIDDIRVVKP